MKLDSFAEIAAQASKRPPLDTPITLIKPQNTLPLGAPVPGAAWQATSKMETQAALEAELERQRELHAPFLQRLAPALPLQRKRQSLVKWQWRMQTPEDRADFSNVLSGEGSWEDLTIPHYGGPVGAAVAYYRTQVEVPSAGEGTDWHLCFEAADYVAQVYCNGRCLGQHEGFYAPFEFLVGPYLIPGGVNTIVVELRNDAPCTGYKLDNGRVTDGDKIYAATGPGWDDPQMGWHHCPPGFGIFGEVFFENRAATWISHAWVRTLDLEGNIEVFLELSGRAFDNRPVKVEYAVYGENFEHTAIAQTELVLSNLVEKGPSLYRFPLKLDAPRIWRPESPWLYNLQVVLSDEGTVVDAGSRTFGVRTFELDTNCEPKGVFRLNGQDIRLMGANTMGFEQQDVMRGDFDQLRDDLLLVKICRMNFLRLTQRPVQDAIYDLCDRLGVMIQSDLPLFAKLRRPQFAEALRQAGEMERMLCPHPCNIVVTYINEPFPASWGVNLTRHLRRAELERFFVAADQIILTINPDRVIKPVDGDYDAPAPGLPDNHCYTMWYVGHMLDAGALHAGQWQPTKNGWNHGCGEFGAEGLDFVDLMRRRYPADWLSKEGDAADEAAWDPARIVNAQSGTHYCFFYDRPNTLEGWVKASHEHQVFATQFMTDAFRRDKQMVTFAIHLFIDAWPSGWMKTIMDCERRAKPAFFAYRHSLSPVHVSLRGDRFTCFGGEAVESEIWVANDSGARLEGAQTHYQVLRGDTVVAEGQHAVPALATADTIGVGVIRFETPGVLEREKFTLRANIVDAQGQILHDASQTLEVFPAAYNAPVEVRVLDGFAPAWLPSNFVAETVLLAAVQPGQTVLCDGAQPLEKIWPQLLLKAKEGTRFVVFHPSAGTYEIEGEQSAVVEACGMGNRHFVSRASGHPSVKSFEPKDFHMWYDDAAGRMTPLLTQVIRGKGGAPVLISGQVDWGKPFEPVDAVRDYTLGKGSILMSCLELKGHMANPVARAFLENLV